MRIALLFTLVLLAACDMAGPGFRGIPGVQREVEGSRFTIRVKEGVAEVIRTNPEFPPRFAEISRKATLAVFQETGCEPAWVTGDPAMMRMGLSCDGKPAPREPRRTTIACEIFDAYQSGTMGGSAAMECTAY